MNEHMGMYEIFAERLLSYNEVISAFVESTNMPPTKVVSDDEFYDLLDNPSLGIELHYYEEGYLSFISLASMPEFKVKEYYKMCSNLAFNLNTNIAVYNQEEDAEDVFIFSPDGFYQEAKEKIGADHFFVQACSDKITINTLISSDHL